MAAVIPSVADTNFDLYCNGRGHIDETTLLKESDSETMIQNLCVCDEGWTSMFFRNYSARWVVSRLCSDMVMIVTALCGRKQSTIRSSMRFIVSALPLPFLMGFSDCVPSSTIPMELMFPAGEWV